MKNIHVLYSATRFFILLFCFSATALPNNLDSTIIIKRLQLISKNDSIDLIKQTFKRKGLPLTELEEMQSTLRDSLKMLNIQIQNTKVTPTSATFPDLIQLISKKPDTIFDWIIIVVGLIAVISGIFLISGIFSMFSSKRKKRKSKKVIKKASEPPPEKPEVPPQPAASAKQALDELRALAGNTSDTVNQLRRQLKNTDTPNVQAEIYSNLRKQPAQEEMPPALFSDSIDQNDVQTQKKIIESAKNGMAPHDISRKYHMSTDQVLLILKVAGVKQKK